MDAPSIDDLRDLLTEALRTYRQLRPQLFDALIELQNTSGGPWKVTYKRDPDEGDPSIPPKVQTQASVKAELKLDDRPDIKFLNLASVFSMPETFAPFHDFAITKDDTPIPPESVAAGIGLRIELILDAMLKASKAFAGGAHAVRKAAREGNITSDARPILALDERLPFFPYWPRFTADKGTYDAELAKEVPLLDAAELAIGLLAGTIGRPSPPKMTDDTDRDAARQALARNVPGLEKSDPAKYANFVEVLADFHRGWGTEKFELHYNLRPPRDRTEGWQQQLMQGKISLEQFGTLLKADAERPIDMEMLKAYHDAHMSRLTHYSEILQLAVIYPSEESTSVRQEKERKIDKHIESLNEKMPLWKENLLTVSDFLEEQKIISGTGLVTLGEFEATFAHWLAELAFTHATQAWRSCKEIAEKSHDDPRYLYSAKAIDLFAQVQLPKLPSPQGLSERMRAEFILARNALNKQQPQNPTPAVNPADPSSTVQQAIDNQSRELTLIGEITATVGKAGHIYRQLDMDWGIDGEIEFKDTGAKPTGRKVYVQLKSGDSYLTKRARDGADIFNAKKRRLLEYWAVQAFPVMLVIREASGRIRWMDVREYLKVNGLNSLQIVFQGVEVTVASMQALARDRLSEKIG